MDVASGTFRPGRRSLLEGPVGDGEAGVQTEHTAHGVVVAVGVDEVNILDEAGGGLAAAVAVAHLVAQERTQAGALYRLGDEVQASRKAGGRGVVVEYSGGAPADALGSGEQGRKTHVVSFESAADAGDLIAKSNCAALLMPEQAARFAKGRKGPWLAVYRLGTLTENKPTTHAEIAQTILLRNGVREILLKKRPRRPRLHAPGQVHSSP